MIKISIIIPVYNAEQYLEQCLESVIKQSLKEIEIICVNDGSIDNSLRILEEYSRKDNRIIIINQENGGSSKARNSALQIAKGEYCLNIDSDDWIEEGYFEAIYNKAKKENLDIVISNYYLIFYIKKENKEKVDLKLKKGEIIEGSQYILLLLTENFIGYMWNKLIKRKLFIQNNVKYNNDIFLLDDMNILIKLAYHAKRIGKLEEAYYYYRIGENNGTKKINFNYYYDIKNCFEDLNEYFKINNIKEYVDILNNRKLYTLYTDLMIKNYKKDKNYKFERDNLLKKLNKRGENTSGLINSKNIKLYLKVERFFLKKSLLFEVLKKIYFIKKFFK